MISVRRSPLLSATACALRWPERWVPLREVFLGVAVDCEDLPGFETVVDEVLLHPRTILMVEGGTTLAFFERLGTRLADSWREPEASLRSLAEQWKRTPGVAADLRMIRDIYEVAGLEAERDPRVRRFLPTRGGNGETHQRAEVLARRRVRRRLVGLQRGLTVQL